jgi:hypothetical protein
MKEKVSVFCIWRDAEEHVYKTLKQLEDIESLSEYEFSYFFYENDSVDNTADVLKNWLETRKGSFLSEKLSAPKFSSTPEIERMKFLCECRNKCKILAKDNDSDYSLLIDGDIEFNKFNFTEQLSNLISLDNAVMTTANVRQNIPDFTFGASVDSYYDSYAFRDAYGNTGLSWSDSPFIRKSDRLKWFIGQPLITMSSFGGFAVIKSSIFNKVKWHSDFHCDHVNMCYDISRYGSIYIIPRSKVYVEIDTSKYDLNSFKDIAQKQFFEK